MPAFKLQTNHEKVFLLNLLISLLSGTTERSYYFSVELTHFYIPQLSESDNLSKKKQRNLESLRSLPALKMFAL